MSTSKGLVDLHCHLDLYPDHQAAVMEAEQAGVFTLAVTTTPRAWPRNHELAQRTKYVRAALGLHPQLVAERASEIELWDRYLPETRYVGEVGLDAGPRYYKSLDLQKKVFQHVLQRCAEAGDKIITIHSVRAVKAVLDHVESFLPQSRGKVVLHWFTGSKVEAQRALELGCYFSINAAMLGSERHASMTAVIPLDRLLTETDGPFTKTDERPSKPPDVRIVVEALGQLHRIAASEVAATIRANLRALLEPNGELRRGFLLSPKVAK
jgi:TatD DNase family protein